MKKTSDFLLKKSLLEAVAKFSDLHFIVQIFTADTILDLTSLHPSFKDHVQLRNSRQQSKLIEART